jgi:hypothetical protein
MALRGATLRNENGEALTLDRAEINGGVVADKGFTADGEVRAVGARIGGVLTLSGATIRNASGNGINLESSSMARLILMPSFVDGRVWLYRTVIGDLITGHQPPGPLVATGWKVSDLHGPLREDVTPAMRWLETDPTSNDPTAKTSVQPWHALAAIYERSGDPAGARKLRYRAAKKMTSQSAGMTKIAGRFYDGLVGHGYYPMRALGWLAVVVLAGWLLVAVAEEDIVPTNMKDAIAAVNDQAVATKTSAPAGPITARTPCDSHPAYPCADSFNFALNALAPASVSANTYWTARPGVIWLTVVLAVLKLFGWVLVALLLAGVTGLLRKT